MPATLQATIAARIDRLPPEAKRTLSAASVIGSRFSLNDLLQLGVEPGSRCAVGSPIHRSGQVHPPTRVCVPPSADSRGRLRVAAQVRSRRRSTGAWPTPSNCVSLESVDENAALIAEHLEAAGDLHAAYSAGTCAPEAGPPTATSPRRGPVGSGRGRSPTRYLPMIRIGCRCVSATSPVVCNRVSRGRCRHSRPTSTNCASFARRRVISGRWRSA